MIHISNDAEEKAIYNINSRAAATVTVDQSNAGYKRFAPAGFQDIKETIHLRYIFQPVQLVPAVSVITVLQANTLGNR